LSKAQQSQNDAEYVLRMKVAACTLMLVNEKCMNYSGHVSGRLPGGDTFLIQPIDVPRSGLRPDDLPRRSPRPRSRWRRLHLRACVACGCPPPPDGAGRRILEHPSGA
jgi:hypothetical protein